MYDYGKMIWFHAGLGNSQDSVIANASYNVLASRGATDGEPQYKFSKVIYNNEEYLALYLPPTMRQYMYIYGITESPASGSRVWTKDDILLVKCDNTSTITEESVITSKEYYQYRLDRAIKGQLPNDFTDWGVATSDIDLNTYNTDSKLGYYIAHGGSHVTNTPEGVTQFGLLVLRAAGTNYAQILYAKDKIYYRNYTNSAWTSWVDLTKDTTYNNATTTIAGLMSANDKVAVDSIAYKRYTLDLTDLDSSTFYPVVLTPNQMNLSTDCEINSQSTIGADPYNLNRVKFSLTSKGVYDEKDTFTLWNAYNYDNNEITIGSIGHTTSGRGGTGVVFLRGGKNYHVITNATPTLYTESYTNTAIKNSPWTVAPGSAITGGTNSAVEFYWKNDSTRDTNEHINAKYGDVYGLNTVTTLESTPVTKKLVIANLTESEILSLAADLPAGHELHIIVNNTSDGIITVTLPYNSYTNAVTQALELAAATPMTLPLDNPEI